MCTLAACLLAGCGGATSPTSPTPISTLAVSPGVTHLAPPSIAVLDGTVKHDRGVDSWPLRGVVVEVLEGGVVTTSTTTDENGYFHFELSPGEVQLRGSKHGYVPRTTNPIRIEAGQRTIAGFRIQPPYVPPTLPAIPYAEWLTRTVSGRVTDMSGRPVPSASVCAIDSGANSAFGCAGTDATGAYTLSFRVPSAERKAATLDVSRTGYPKQQFLLECCVSADPQVVNVTMLSRVVRVELLGPTVLRVMVPVQLMAVVTFEDGSTVTVKPILLDVRGTIQNSGQGSGMIEAIREGGGTAWWSHQGVSGALIFTVTS